ncbi:MAG TPA: porin [Kofleriaceae bacterium]|nr:porin [Kofleriaceae bacterium]
MAVPSSRVALALLAAWLPAGRAAADQPTVSLSGYLQAQYTAFADGDGDDEVMNDALALRRVRLRVRARATEWLGATVMFDPSTTGNLLRDAYASVTAIPYHEIRVGQQKTQFGYENPESSTRLWTSNRALVSDALARGSDLRDLGVGLLAEIPVGGGLAAEYAVTVVNGAGPNTAADDTDSPSLWARLGPRWSAPGDVNVRAGASLAAGTARLPDPADPAGSIGADFVRVGVDLEVDAPWLFAAAEVIGGEDDPVRGRRVRGLGWYALAVGKLPWRSGALARFDLLDPDRDTAGDTRRRVTLGGFHDLQGGRARVRLEAELDRSAADRDHRLLAWAQVLF